MVGLPLASSAFSVQQLARVSIIACLQNLEMHGTLLCGPLGEHKLLSDGHQKGIVDSWGLIPEFYSGIFVTF
jgi:hypothetical protein